MALSHLPISLMLQLRNRKFIPTVMEATTIEGKVTEEVAIFEVVVAVEDTKVVEIE